MAKAETVVTVTQDPTTGIITATVKGARPDGTDEVIAFDPSKAHADNNAYARFHGYKARFVDSAAMSRDTKDGASATPATKAAAIRKVVDHLESGVAAWSRVSEGGPKGGYLFEALCKVYGHMKAPTEIRAWLDGLSDKEQAALREDDTVAPVIAEMKAAKPKVASGVDTKALLAGLKPADPATPDATAPTGTIDGTDVGTHHAEPGESPQE